MTVIKENTMEASSPRSGLSSTVRMNVTTQTTFRKNNRTNVIRLPWVVISNKSRDPLRPLKRQQSLGFKCAHHVNFVGPPQCRNVQKLLHHAMEVDIDDGGQHSLDSQHRGLRNIPAPCMLIVTHNSVNKIHRIPYQKLLLQCSSKSLDMDALVGRFCFFFTFGKSSKRTPIQSVMKRITIAERAPATCSDTKTKVYGRIMREMRRRSGLTELISDCEWNRGIFS